MISQDDFIGCPTNNDFYYNGTINSPLYPYNYPPNDKCYYYITAEPGKVLKWVFQVLQSHNDMSFWFVSVTNVCVSGSPSPTLIWKVAVILSLFTTDQLSSIRSSSSQFDFYWFCQAVIQNRRTGIQCDHCWNLLHNNSQRSGHFWIESDHPEIRILDAIRVCEQWVIPINSHEIYNSCSRLTMQSRHFPRR